MKKTVGILTVIALIALMCCGASTTFATTESLPVDFEEFSAMLADMLKEPVDYDGLFDLSNQVDGAYAELYFHEMNRLFDANPETFIEALSEQSYERISSFSYVLAFERCGDLDGYRATLAAVPERDALFMLRMGILIVEARPNTANPDYFVNTYHEQVQTCYKENSRLFLASFAGVGDFVYSEMAAALVYEVETAELQTLRQSLSEDVESDWIPDNARDFITVVHQKIDVILNPRQVETPEPPISDTEPSETPSEQTESTTPTTKEPEPPEKPSYTVWIVVAVVAVVAMGAVVIAVLKKR